ncbi:MAG: hypothetical protein FJ102_06075 [Deltaproteobacteria bacterium]|nr:hypothetical protein [Deltaproteobacteria bacterium]
MFSFLTLLLGACSASLEGSASELGGPSEFVLTTYDVPRGYESRVEDVLNRVFWLADEVPPLGRARQGAPGSVIVAAPASVQGDVKGVIERLNRLDPAVAEPRNVKLSYWMIGGTRADAVDTSALPAVIAPAMAEVAGQEVPMRYEVLFRESLLSLDGTRAQANGPEFQIEQLASVSPAGSIVAELGLSVQGGVETRTQLTLGAGQVLVLGQTAVGGNGGPPGSSDAIFYVVRPEPVAAQ